MYVITYKVIKCDAGAHMEVIHKYEEGSTSHQWSS